MLGVDLDPQGNTTSGLGRKAGDKSIYEALLGREPLRACMQDTAVRGLTLVGADIRLAGAELELVFAVSDLFNALMVLPNLICLLLCSGTVARELLSYESTRKVRTR